MLSISCNSRIKSWRNSKKSWQNNRSLTFINKYKSEGINLSSEKDDWKRSEKTNVTIAVNVLYVKNKNISCLCFKK